MDFKELIIKDLFENQGYSTQDIATIIGRSEQFVSLLVKERGFKKKKAELVNIDKTVDHIREKEVQKQLALDPVYMSIEYKMLEELATIMEGSPTLDQLEKVNKIYNSLREKSIAGSFGKYMNRDDDDKGQNIQINILQSV